MKTLIDQGGYAFPTSRDDTGDGMTLRDWFAGMALQGLLAANFFANSACF